MRDLSAGKKLAPYRPKNKVQMDAVRHCSPGQITAALFEVGGQYRRNM